MKPWPKHPVIYEINTWVWLSELSRKYKSLVNLATVPEEEWTPLLPMALTPSGSWECGNGARPELKSPCETRGCSRISGEPFLTLEQRTMSGRPIVCAATSSTNISVGRRGLRQPVRLLQNAAFDLSSILFRTMSPRTTIGPSSTLNILSGKIRTTLREIERRSSRLAERICLRT